MKGLQQELMGKNLIAILVASLGYFVDIFDLQLFNLVSKESLKGIGIIDELLIKKLDYTLFLWQMGGMLLGGILWGILGDKKGRKSILFGSILLYSIANILNGFVVNVEQYKIIRLIAGIGLAGELGAAITLISEIMKKETRGYGTMIIVSFGALGAVFAVLITKYFTWQHCYFIGGGLGLLLLLLRVGTLESAMFESMKLNNTKKGDFFSLFTHGSRFIKYIKCIMIGLPVWFVIGVLIKFSPDFARNMGLIVTPDLPKYAIMYAYIGLSLGDLFSGWLSQYLKSRKKVVIIYLIFTILLIPFYLFTPMSYTVFYTWCGLLGAATGYWALFVTIASEQFGTNIRATASTTVPNFVRGALIPITLCYKYLEIDKNMGNVQAAIIVGLVTLFLAFFSMISLKETFGKDLNYMEKN